MELTSPSAAAPKVSVCVISHNHERFIRECLDSIFSQEVDFEFEVVVADDLSTDRTREIVVEFAERHPGRMRLLVPATKIGAVATFVSLHDAARGEYIAHIDGDDMMLPGRLQAQADFLDAHPECVMVGHDMRIVSRATGDVIAESYAKRPIPEVTDTAYLLANGCFFAHSAKTYRRSANASWDRNEPVVDFYLHVAHALQGKVGYIDRVLGVYRRGAGSISDVNSPHFLTVVRGHLRAFEHALQHGFAPALVYPLMARYRYVNAMHCLRNGRVDCFRELIRLDADLRPHATSRHRIVDRIAPLTPVARQLVRTYDGIARLQGRKAG
jgi:glycosyltransferase involved in cell wall biosynthesis